MCGDQHRDLRMLNPSLYPFRRFVRRNRPCVIAADEDSPASEIGQDDHPEPRSARLDPLTAESHGVTFWRQGRPRGRRRRVFSPRARSERTLRGQSSYVVREICARTEASS